MGVVPVLFFTSLYSLNHGTTATLHIPCSQGRDFCREFPIFGKLGNSQYIPRFPSPFPRKFLCIFYREFTCFLCSLGTPLMFPKIPLNIHGSYWLSGRIVIYRGKFCGSSRRLFSFYLGMISTIFLRLVIAIKSTHPWLNVSLTFHMESLSKKVKRLTEQFPGNIYVGLDGSP